MKGTYRTISGSLFTLNRGRKYTKLFYKMFHYVWTNKTIDDILGSYENQVKHFKENLK